VPLKTRIEQHEALLSDNTLNKATTILSIWPAPMFYAGPAEVLFHFSSRVNANVDFMIVGRDPAGIKHPIIPSKDLFDPSHGSKVLEIAFEKGLLRKMQILPFKVAVYNKESKQMEYFNEENKHKYDNISGSKMRQLAKENSPLPVGFMNDKGWEILVEYYKGLN
jgi:3'-phosphoadenosine 5'-phosphosulfate synthase